MALREALDIVAIGDMTTDAFIKLKEAHISCRLSERDCEICLPFGEKIPFESIKIIRGAGNAANVAIACSRLGLRTALISDIGDDQNGQDCLSELQQNGVITKHITKHKGKATNYHFVLWYDMDRTILVNHIRYAYALPKFARPKWIYLTSLPEHSETYHSEIAEYLEKNPEVKLAFQPGTFQIRSGYESLKRIYSLTEILIVNLEEAQKILEIKNRGIKTLLFKLQALGPKLVSITDGVRGSYMFDGDHYYHMPQYSDPKPGIEKTGCGDAWAATFVSAIAMGTTPLEALTWAPINPMSVAQFVGSHEGLLTKEQIKWWLERAPEEYKPKEI